MQASPRELDVIASAKQKVRGIGTDRDPGENVSYCQSYRQSGHAKGGHRISHRDYMMGLINSLCSVLLPLAHVSAAMEACNI